MAINFLLASDRVFGDISEIQTKLQTVLENSSLDSRQVIGGTFVRERPSKTKRRRRRPAESIYPGCPPLPGVLLLVALVNSILNVFANLTLLLYC